MGGFADVIWIVCGIGIIVAIATVAGSGKAWKEYSERGMLMERPREEAPSSPVDSAVAVEEIRQMLEAANARRARRGEAAIDIEAEVARLISSWPGTTPAHDPGVVAEVRTLIELRNRRRIRNGESPLDVDAEVAAKLAELDS